MDERLKSTCFRAVCLAAALLAAGCAAQAKQALHSDNELLQLDEWLPGRYDNQGQIAADAKAGRPAHEPVALYVVPVDALQMGRHVFYVQESAGHVEPPGTPRLILAEHLASISAVNGKLVAALYSFTDPQRWRDGISMPEVFSSLQPQDVKLMRGCALTFTPESQKYVAVDEPSHCLTSSALTGSVESLRIRVELTRDEIAMSNAPPQADGSNPAAETYTRFRRGGGL